MRELRDVPYLDTGDGENCLNAFLPDTDGFVTLLHFHGGGLDHGSYKGQEHLLPLVEAGYGVVSAGYRLMPGVRFPTFLEDAARAVAFVQKQLKSWGGSGRLFIEGSSAGAYITMMLLMDPHYLQDAGVDVDSIAGFISESAQMCTHFNVLKHRGEDSRLQRIDEAAPMYYVSERLHRRPLQVIWYTRDMYARPEENRLMVAALRRYYPAEELDARELEGKHCKPDEPSQRLEAYTTFMEGH